MPDIKVENSESVEYKYRPMSKPLEIRIVRLHPTKSEDGTRGPVSIEIVHTTLEEAPSFIGSSYTWGSSMRNDTVSTTSNEVLYITENVRDTLRRLDPEGSDQPTYIWIDQLCINQADDEEKWQQVRIMRRIYKHAMGTFVVLSRQDDAVDELFFIIGQLQVTPLRSIIGPWSRVRPALSDASFTVFADPEFRNLLMRVVNNVVFSRAWIYQEIISSKRAILLGNKYMIDWDVFATVFMQCLLLETQTPTDRVMNLSSVSGLNVIINDRISLQAGGHKDWMLLQIEAQGLFHCSDLRDIVVAFKTFEFPETPRYYQSLSISTLYQVTACTMIEASRSLDIFAAISGHWHSSRRLLEGMPSWVPDWSRARDSIPLCWPMSATAFSAAKDYKHEPVEDGERRVLQVRGKKVDIVRTIVDHRFDELSDEKDLTRYFCLQRICASHAAHAEKKGTPLKTSTLNERRQRGQAMIAAMTATYSSYSSFTTDNFVGSPPDATFNDELVFMLTYHDDIMEDAEPLYHRGLPHALSFMPRTYGGWKSAMSKLRQWGSICVGRRIVFGEGQGFGLVPKTTHCGDMVFILHGSKVPVVLRRLGRCYRVVGQCYWHDWMYGENVNWSEGEGDRFKLV